MGKSLLGEVATPVHFPKVGEMVRVRSSDDIVPRWRARKMEVESFDPMPGGWGWVHGKIDGISLMFSYPKEVLKIAPAATDTDGR